MELLIDRTESPNLRHPADPRATFLRLIDEYRPALHRLVTGYASAPSDREDLFQEIALSLWRAIPHFRGESSERTWLYRIAHNSAITASARRRGREVVERSTPDPPDVPAPSFCGAEHALLLNERRILLENAVQSLAPRDRQIVLLHLEGVDHAGIEEITGISKELIATRLSRARIRLASVIHERQSR